MKISIFGMGYVGATSAACLLKHGHEIIGVDVDERKVANLSIGKTPMIYEKGVEELLYKGYKEGRLISTNKSFMGVVDCDMIWVCVGTPSKFNGDINFEYLDKVINDIAEILRDIENRPLIVIRSTCLPGTISKRLKPLLEKKSNLVVGKDINLVFHPEFLREGSAIEDFINPSKIVIGEFCEGSSDILLDIYKDYEALIFKLNIEEAEMVKYCDNLFHILKITFANEVASLSHSIGVDSRKIADVYCSDKKLNISEAYLRPGNPYGGSCLPKDLRAILRFASLNYIRVPMLQGIIESNKIQIENLVSRILRYRPKSVGIVGISFKLGTDDIRESPYVKIAKALIGEGVELFIYDKMININDLIGDNKKQINKDFRNIDKLLVSSLDDFSSVDLILINHPVIDDVQVKKWVEKGIRVIDLANIQNVDRSLLYYEGVYW
jgi:GDP-mannose 6-dehydrogenase